MLICQPSHIIQIKIFFALKFLFLSRPRSKISKNISINLILSTYYTFDGTLLEYIAISERAKNSSQRCHIWFRIFKSPTSRTYVRQIHREQKTSTEKQEECDGQFIAAAWHSNRRRHHPRHHHGPTPNSKLHRFKYKRFAQAVAFVIDDHVLWYNGQKYCEHHVRPDLTFLTKI